MQPREKGVINLGENLRNLRRTANITQSELAERMNIHLQTVSKWERGVFEPDVSQLGEIAGILGVSLERLLGLEETGRAATSHFDPERFGKIICELRSRNGETQLQLADELDISTDTVSRWERGITCPDVEKLIEIARHFGITVSDLYCGTLEDDDSKRPLKKRKKRFAVRAALFSVIAACAVVFAVIFGGVFAGAKSSVVYEVTIDGIRYTYSQGDPIVPDMPEKQGYVFDGWQDSEGNPVYFPVPATKNASYSPVFSPREYTIDYWLNGGYFTYFPTNTFTVESGAIELSAPQKAGMEFQGWFLEPDYSGEKVAQIECKCASVCLYAKWDKVSYTVRYELNGGLLPDANATEIYSDIEETLCIPIRKGYSFIGWYDSPDGGTRYETVGGQNAKNITLYARWQKNDEIYIITYHLDGGKVLQENPATVSAGELRPLFDAEKTGYDFVGWCDNPDGVGTYYTRLYGIESSLELYAVYRPKEYLIRYVYEGRYYTEEVNPNRIFYGQRIELLPVYRYGYEFTGWYDSPEDGNLISVIDENVTTLSVLYAVYQPNLYTVLLVGAGGQIPTEKGEQPEISLSFTFGESITLPGCVRSGYYFYGWTNDKGEVIVKIDESNAANTVLTAQWKKINAVYSIEYVLNGGTLDNDNPVTASSGESVPLSSPRRDEHRFLGWYDNPYGTGEPYDATPLGREESLTLYALWQDTRVSGSIAKFDYLKSEEGVTITGYKGGIGAGYVVDIPAVIDESPVVALDCELRGNYRAIHLPDGITRLGENCFSGVTLEQPFTIPASVVEIGKNCFTGAIMQLYFADNSKIEIIGEYAFEQATIKNVIVFPESLKIISYRAFFNASCPGYILPENLQIIESYALSTMNIPYGYKFIYIPSGVSYIGKYGVGVWNDGYAYTGFSEQQAEKFASSWMPNLRCNFNHKPSYVTFRDGEDIDIRYGCAFAIPQKEKNGYRFIGWKDEKGELVPLLFIPTRDTTLTACYLPKSNSDGYDKNSPAELSIDSDEKLFYGRIDSAFYFKVATDVPVRLLFEISCGQGMGILYAKNDLGEYSEVYSGVVLYKPGDVYMLKIKNGSVSCVFTLRLKISLL